MTEVNIDLREFSVYDLLLYSKVLTELFLNSRKRTDLLGQFLVPFLVGKLFKSREVKLVISLRKSSHTDLTVHCSVTTPPKPAFYFKIDLPPSKLTKRFQILMFKIMPTDKQTLPEYIDVCIVLIISGQTGFLYTSIYEYFGGTVTEI